MRCNNHYGLNIYKCKLRYILNLNPYAVERADLKALHRRLNKNITSK